MVEAVQRTLLPEGSGPDDGPEWSTILNGKLSIKALDGDHDQPAPEQALREAAAKGDLATLDVLLASATSFDINSVNPKTGKTALHYALQAPNSMEVVKRLLKAGIDMTIKDKTGKTAFDLTSGPFALHLMPARFLMVAAATGQLKKAVAKRNTLISKGTRRTGPRSTRTGPRSTPCSTWAPTSRCWPMPGYRPTTCATSTMTTRRWRR